MTPEYSIVFIPIPRECQMAGCQKRPRHIGATEKGDYTFVCEKCRKTLIRNSKKQE